MKIEEKIEKYLVREKASKKEAFEKVRRTIRSLKNKNQFPAAVKMIKNYVNLYGESFYTDIMKWFSGDLIKEPEYQKHGKEAELYRMLADQIKRLDFAGKVKK